MSEDERKIDAAMERYADGDDAAFGDIYDALAPQLRSFLRRSIREHVEDLVQQTFCQVHLARGSFIRGARVKPWVFAVARRLLIDRLRRAKHEAAARTEQPLWAPFRVHGPEEPCPLARRQPSLERCSEPFRQGSETPSSCYAAKGCRCAKPLSLSERPWRRSSCGRVERSRPCAGRSRVGGVSAGASDRPRGLGQVAGNHELAVP